MLDGEAIALDQDGRPRPFQETASRTASSADGITAVTPYFFDVLHLDGRDLLDLPATERWAALDALVPEQHRVPRWRGTDPEAARAFAAQVLADGHEGVVVKTAQAPYAAGRRGSAWVKVKPVHTLDLVVLAVEWGSGRRRGLLSNIHLGARDETDPERFVMLGKTFKGMTDEMLAWQTERFQELKTHEDDWTVHVRPEQVVEIAFDGLQRSTRYPGGLALRFARVVRYRDDKGPEDADTIQTLEPDVATPSCTSRTVSAWRPGHPRPTDAARLRQHAGAPARNRSSRPPASSSTPGACATSRSRRSPAPSASTGRSSTGTSPARRSCSRSPSSATSTSCTRPCSPRPASSEDTSDRLAAVVGAFFDYGVAHPAFVDCALALMVRPGDELLDDISEGALFRLGRGITSCMTILSDVLADGIGSGEFSVTGDPVLMANTMYASGLGALQLARLGILVSEAAPGIPTVSEMPADQVRHYVVSSALALVTRDVRASSNCERAAPDESGAARARRTSAVVSAP